VNSHSLSAWVPWARTLKQQGWQEAARAFWEVSAPFHLLGAQVLHAFGPLALSPETLKALTGLLEDEQEKQAFLSFLRGE